ncbi:MAG: YggS family pyridoxal phosphate-dependent enzyme [Kiritimatiellae bacterium]|nr:YggS family pyridoxal phosphate-dependent enzyme [Kiritimatiellia bacterium]
MSESFQERLDVVNRRIAAACARSGRDPSEVKLVAVSKTHGPDAIREAADCGLTVFGESKVQEAEAKIPLCPGHVTWHLVGHLQRNKIRRAIPFFDTIHSIDSVRLLEALNAALDEAGRTMRVLLEINVSGEAAKFGLRPEDLPAVLEAAPRCPRVDVVGLMTMPPWCEEPERARTFFRQLRELRERCRGEWGFPMSELSMGMSHDFEVAIEEGATWIRIGTDLFGSRKAEGGKWKLQNTDAEH